MRTLASSRSAAGLVVLVALSSACSSKSPADQGQGGASSSSSSSSGAGGMGGAEDQAAIVYPNVAALHRLGVAPTCSLNGGVCHTSKDYPELGDANDMLGLLGAPCQLGAADPALVIDECEVPGDEITLGGKDYEVMLVKVTEDQPYPPKSVQLKLASMPVSLDATGAKIHRVVGAKDVLSKSLAGVTVTAIDKVMFPDWVVLDISAAMDMTLGDFLDPRAWHGERIRMGDPNQNGIAHAAKTPWAEIFPSDPARSFFYTRLVVDKYGAEMPLIPRTWSPLATRAVWCWIRGMPATASGDTVHLTDPIDYATCPQDPNAPDPNASGGWASVKALVGSRCATADCHGSDMPKGDLNLTPDAATFAKNVIDAPAMQEPGALLVVPGQVSASYLYCKVNPSCMSRAPKTDLMPITGTPLTAAEIKLFSDWIADGAPTE